MRAWKIYGHIYGSSLNRCGRLLPIDCLEPSGTNFWGDVSPLGLSPGLRAHGVGHRLVNFSCSPPENPIHEPINFFFIDFGYKMLAGSFVTFWPCGRRPFGYIIFADPSLEASR